MAVGVTDLVKRSVLTLGFLFLVACWVSSFSFSFLGLLGLLMVWTFSRFACCFIAVPRKWYRGFQSGCVPTARSSGFRGRIVFGRSWLPWPCIFLLLGCIRVGEALHPGPSDAACWTCEIFNPSGLTTKVDYVASLTGDILLGSETHLTKAGIARIRQGLRANVTGAPCPQRVQAEAGTYAGVIALSSFPARPLPHSMDADIWSSARALVCGIAVRQMWIQIGLAYGYPHSSRHKHRTYRTECLLDEVITRIAVQSRGPRIVCGDFNHQASDLQQIERLRHLGFCEVQDLACHAWGQEIQPTSSGPFVIDQMWISPELQGLLKTPLLGTIGLLMLRSVLHFLTLALNWIVLCGSHLLRSRGRKIGCPPLRLIGLTLRLVMPPAWWYQLEGWPNTGSEELAPLPRSLQAREA